MFYNPNINPRVNMAHSLESRYYFNFLLEELVIINVWKT